MIFNFYYIRWFLANAKGPNQRHVYFLELDQTGSVVSTPMTLLRGQKDPGNHAGTFSASFGYVILNYFGPELPERSLIKASSPDWQESLSKASSDLLERLKKTKLPKVEYSSIGGEDDGNYELIVKTFYPPGFDPKKKYPVITLKFICIPL